MPQRKLLILADSRDPVAASFAEFAASRAAGISIRQPASFWESLRPRLEVEEQGSLLSTLDSFLIFNRLGFAENLDDWNPSDRHYAAMESSAALLAFLAFHPAIINRPKAEEFSGLGLRSVEQFSRAGSLGLKVPSWTMTTDIQEARKFILNTRPVALYRRNSEELFEFSRAAEHRLPIGDGRLTGPVFLLQGFMGLPIISTWACGHLWHVNAISKAPFPLGDETQQGLWKFFNGSGLVFAQAVGIIEPWTRDYVFYGMTGYPQWRFYRPFAGEVHEKLWRVFSHGI